MQRFDALRPADDQDIGPADEEAGLHNFYELNDVLQYLGHFAFRPPTSAYKHSAAQFLKLRGWIASNEPHPKAPRRPESDIEILQKILEQLEALT